MKKILTFLITATIIITTLLPVQGFALQNKELENAINTAKTALDIGDGYDDFSYNMYKSNNETRYNLSWRDTKNKLGNIDVTINTNGRIVSYYSYNKEYDDSSNRSKLPKVSKADALKTSNAFIQKIDSSIYNKIKYEENDEAININSSNYYFNYVRFENGIPFYNNYVNVSIDGNTGKVESFYCEWADDYVFPDASGIIALSKAQQIYKDKLGLKLLYKISHDDSGSKPYLSYGPVYSNRSIDAKTGEVIDTSSYYGPMYDKGGMGASGNSESAQKEAALTPEEKKAVENSADFLSESKVEEIARKTLNLDSTYNVESANLYNDYMNKSDYIWNIYFRKENQTSTANGEYIYASASIDAKTGEITSFYRSLPYDSNAAVKYNKEQALKIAQDLINSLQPERSKYVKYTDFNNSDVRPLNAEQPKEHSFTFTRVSDGAYFLDNNGFNVTVDTTQGIVLNYNLSWYKGELPKPNNVITSDKAHEILFSTIGLQTQYIADYANTANSKSSPDSNTKPVIRLVYSIKSGKPASIDAFTGKILDYSGKPYVEKAAANYSDIKGNKAENAIKILSQYGISLPGTEFKPDTAIIQKDFLYLLAKSINPSYMVNDITSDDEDKLYNYLINSKIINENEKSPKSSVAKQDALKFIIRALKYDHIADIKGIYSLPFLDKDKINPDLYGYAAIGYGLNIVKDDNGYLKPTENITRGDAALMLYNLLNID